MVQLVGFELCSSGRSSAKSASHGRAQHQMSDVEIEEAKGQEQSSKATLRSGIQSASNRRAHAFVQCLNFLASETNAPPSRGAPALGDIDEARGQKIARNSAVFALFSVP
jgi:hypothetical protein